MRELEAIKDGSCVEGNIAKEDSKMTKINQLGEHGMDNEEITQTPTLNKICAMKRWWWKWTWREGRESLRGKLGRGLELGLQFHPFLGKR